MTLTWSNVCKLLQSGLAPRAGSFPRKPQGSSQNHLPAVSPDSWFCQEEGEKQASWAGSARPALELLTPAL